jgi:GNAT superfamily N-acetyltransferase
MSEWSLRLAEEADVGAIAALIPLSVRRLQADYYSAGQMEGSLGSVFGVDRQLIRDETYFVAVARGTKAIVGCGGWSKRKTLFGSDHHQTNRDDRELDPAIDSARVRAFFVHPDWARRGIARAILMECESAIRVAGFHSIELAATLPGLPFYAAVGYAAGEKSEVPLGNGETLAVVRMTKRIP